MSHMKKEIDEDYFVVAETKAGTFAFPADFIGVSEERSLAGHELDSCRDFLESEATEAKVVFGWFGRMSAPGYLDSTDWSGPFDSEEETEEHLEEMYGDE